MWTPSSSNWALPAVPASFPEPLSLAPATRGLRRRDADRTREERLLALLYVIMKSVFRLAARRTGVAVEADLVGSAPVSEKRVGLNRCFGGYGDCSVAGRLCCATCAAVGCDFVRLLVSQ